MTYWPDWDRKDNPERWDNEARDYLEPGFAGELTKSQMQYIRDVAQKKRQPPTGMRGKFRHWWGFTGNGVASEAAIRAVAAYGDPDDPEHNAALVRAVKGIPDPKEPEKPANTTRYGIKGRQLVRTGSTTWWNVYTFASYYEDLDEVAAYCKKVNASGGEDDQRWPIEIDLSTGTVVRKYPELVGLGEEEEAEAGDYACRPSGRRDCGCLG